MAVLLVTCAPAFALELYSNNDIDLRWDNTIRYSSAIRLAGPNHDLIRRPNSDDGDRNFASGFISNRLDLFSQADLAVGDFGLHASAAAWYDAAYHGRTDNVSDVCDRTPRRAITFYIYSSGGVCRCHQVI